MRPKCQKSPLQRTEKILSQTLSKVKENEEKSILSFVIIKEKDTPKIKCSFLMDGNKVTITETLLLMMKDKEYSDLQEVLEIVKEFV